MSFFFFNDTATTEIYTLSLHDALPISVMRWGRAWLERGTAECRFLKPVYDGDTMSVTASEADRKSTRLNSSHSQISYAVFCLKKKKFTVSAGILNDGYYPTIDRPQIRY